MEGRNQRAFAARITFAHRPCLEAGMGNVATAAPGDSHFREELMSAFVERNFVRGVRFRARNRREKPGRAAANYRYFFCHG